MSGSGRKVFDLGRHAFEPFKLNGAGGLDPVEAGERFRAIGEQLKRTTLASLAIPPGLFRAFGNALADARNFEASLAEVARASSILSPVARAEYTLARLRSSGGASEAQIVELLQTGSRESADELLDAALSVTVCADRELRARLKLLAFGPEVDPAAIDFAAWRADLDDEGEP